MIFFIGGLAKTISGVAKQATGGISGFRKILNANSGLIPFALPPQIQVGLKVASVVGGAVGIKVPSADQLEDMARGRVDSILGGLKRDVLGGIATSTDKRSAIIESLKSGKSYQSLLLSKIDARLGSFGNTVLELEEDVLQSIDWLL